MARRQYRFTHRIPEEDKKCKKTCDWPGCEEPGEHRAPKSREKLNEYYWYCLDHAREYNKSWNYYEGMKEPEIENDLRHDTV